MSSVFISYSGKDGRHFAMNLRDLLDKKEIGSFLDFVDNLEHSASWIDNIRKAIENSDILVVLLSNNHLESSTANFELGAAWGQGKPLIPLVLPNTDPENIPPLFDNTKVIYINSKDDLKQAIPHIRRILNLKDNLIDDN